MLRSLENKIIRFHFRFKLNNYAFPQNKNIRRYKSNYLITTPIFYVNDKPHLGHLYSAALADAVSRYQKMKSPTSNIKFMTGTDEHGQKVSASASKNNTNELEHCDKFSEQFKLLFDGYDISYTDFVRTTENRHIENVEKLWKKIADNGHISLDEYSGWYCESEEAFVAEKFLEERETKDGYIVKETKNPVQFIKELNYKFNLGHFENDILYWLEGDVIKPAKFKEDVKRLISNENLMKDLSVSRPAERVPWGIPVPNDPSQNIYVWFDALCSYLTTSGFTGSDFHWPPDLQIIGKDILKFHGIIWPSLLIAAGLEPPRCILCHSFWLYKGEKMSKSKGNVVDPMEKLQEFSSDGLRYYLLRTGVPSHNGNFSEPEAINIVNAELNNKLGNLLNRATSKAINPDQIFPHYSSEIHQKYISESAVQLMNCLKALPDGVCCDFENYCFDKGIDRIMFVVQSANQFFAAEEPWKIVKNSMKRDQLEFILHLSLETLRICGILLQPIVPKLSRNLLNFLKISEDRRSLDSVRPFSWERDIPSSHVPLNVSSPVRLHRIIRS